ncbi:hypothetical protein EUGRSUZ_A02996 [Eucalyptus grandis]|uniref:Uncharacterized protein n=2 Tax=Eucalyptus grandis TaxID=71139 RepID=A0ACC3M9D4_EUCGR|nr:hypothetical protein EUGRSUZ_A02996 [Eucalyptus grandis]
MKMFTCTENMDIGYTLYLLKPIYHSKYTREILPMHQSQNTHNKYFTSHALKKGALTCEMILMKSCLHHSHSNNKKFVKIAW